MKTIRLAYEESLVNANMSVASCFQTIDFDKHFYRQTIGQYKSIPPCR